MFHAERDYFESLKSPSPESSFSMLYVKRLRLLAEKQCVFNLCQNTGPEAYAFYRKAFDETFSVKITYSTSEQIDAYRNHPTIRGTEKEGRYHDSFDLQTRKLEAQRTAVTEQLLAIQTEVARMEDERGINPRWVPGCSEWEAAVKREAVEDYHHALRNLESLVVQRIAELEKAHSVRTGELFCAYNCEYSLMYTNTQVTKHACKCQKGSSVGKRQFTAP